MSVRRGYLPGDIVTIAYLSVTGLIMLVARPSASLPGGLVAAHFGILALAVASRWVPRDGSALLRFVRSIYPLAGLPFFYSSVQYLNRIPGERYFDAAIVHLEGAIFHCQPSQVLYKALPWWPLSEFLHLAYGLYLLLVPIGILVLWLRRHDRALQLFTTSVLGTFFTCYLIFIFAPVKGPFQHIGPIDPGAKGLFFPQIVHRLLLNASSVGTAFPSSHVAVAFTIWWVIRSYAGRWRVLFFIAAIGILVGTVYGGYHYAIDALAGMVLGLAGGLVWPRVHAWLGRRLGMEASA